MEKETTRIRAIRFFYGLIAAGYLVCVVLQVFFAGMGIFVNSDDLQLHRVFANYFEFASVVLFLLSFFGRIKGGLRWLPLFMFAITALQHMTVQQFYGSLRALHTVDALILFGISFYLAQRTWPWLLMRRN